jgi:hypothetical protein
MTSGDPHNPSEHVEAGPGEAPAPAPSEHVPADPGHGAAEAHAHAPDHAAHAAYEQAHFPPEHWQELREADKTAAAYIVVLMQGIFVTGLVLYLIVLWSTL